MRSSNIPRNAPGAAAAIRRPVLALLVAAAGWEALSLILGSRLFPPPDTVVPLFLRLFPSVILPHFAASALRTLAAVALASVAGAPIGILLGRSATLDALLSPAAYLLYPVPKIAFLPVVLLAFGLNDAARIFIVFLIVSFQVTVSVRDGVRGIEASHFRTARTLGLGRMAVLRWIVLPAMLPSYFASQRTATGTAVSVLFFSESVAATTGLGFYVMDAWTRVAYAEMFSGILALGLLGLLLFASIDLAERLLCPWKAGQ
jgi:NitT/TauT family transport system permease protein